MDKATQVLKSLPEEEWLTEPEEEAAFWVSDVIQDELRAQLRLIEAVETFDNTLIASRRNRDQ